MIVGLGFDGNDTNLLRITTELAKRVGSQLHLVHVCRSWVDHPLMVTFPAGYYSYTVASAIDKEEIEKAEAKMKDIVAKTKALGVDATSNVLLGNVAQGLISESLSERASLICTGSSHVSKEFTAKGFSTALSLMADSTLPTMILPSNATLDFSRKNLRLLLADDLTHTSDSAVEVAMDLATSLKTTRLIHMHVGAYSEQELKDVGKKLLSAMAAGQIKYDPRFSEGDILNEMKRHISQRLTERAQGFKPQLEMAAGEYVTRAFAGEVETEIIREAGSEDADVLIFGHHEFMHSKPFSLGKVPFAAMLAMKKPVLMVPAMRQLSK